MTTDPLTGTTALQRYSVEHLSAHGGMASVYRGHDPVLNRSVALKVLHAHLAADPACVERFRREAMAAAGLTHPGIISVFDTGDVAGRPCLVMEFMSGGSLSERLAQGPLSVDDAVTVGVTVARALIEAHRHGLIHRDVKPGNILFTDGGTPKLGDFGIAKANQDGLTQTGHVIGTARYLAPEQLKGQPASPASDQFSLGVVLYESLAGRPPFGAGDDPTGGLVRTQPVPRLRALVPSLSPAIEAVIGRMMADEPGDRFDDCEQAARALIAALHVPAAHTALGPAPRPPAPRPPSLQPPTTRPRRKRAVGRAVVVVLVALMVAVAGALAVTLARNLTEEPAAAGPGSSGPAPDATLPVELASDFDPGRGGEHPEEVGLVIDRDPTTMWTSESYREQFPALKPGVGVWVDLGSTKNVRAVTVRSPAVGWQAEIRLSDADGAPTTLEGFRPVATVSDASPTAQVDARARRVLVWVTRLPPADLRMVIGEIEIAG